MNSNQKYDPWLETFQQQTIEVAGLSTSIYLSESNPELPTYVFVHGLSGDHFGVVQLAYELRDEMNMVLLDLPGHGHSEIPQEATIAWLRQWSEQFLECLEDQLIDVDGVIGHSFGCFIAQYMRSDNIVLCNPPFAIPAIARHYASFAYVTRYVLGDALQAYPLAISRGLFMLHERSAAAVDRSKWITKKNASTKEQIVYQAVIGKITAGECMDILQLQQIPELLIITSDFDRVAYTPDYVHQKLQNARFESVPTDHVSVSEAPGQVAGLIMKTVSARV